MKISAISLPKPVPPKLKPSSKAAKNSEPTKRCLHPRQHLAQHLGARIQATISAQHLDNAGGHRPGLVWRPFRPRARRLRVASRTVIPSATLPIISIQLLPETSARPTLFHSYRPAAATAIHDLRDLLTDSGILRRRIFPQSWACPAPSLPLRPPQHPGLSAPCSTTTRPRAASRLAACEPGWQPSATPALPSSAWPRASGVTASPASTAPCAATRGGTPTPPARL